MFKKGDRIERINSDFGITYVGNIYTVKECGKDNTHYDYYVLLEEDKQPNRRYNADSFILAKEDKCQSLEEMVKMLEDINKREIKDKIETLERSLNYLLDDKERAFRTVAEYCKKEKETMAEIDRLKEQSIGTFNAENDLKAIMEHDTVEKVEINEDKEVIVYTNQLYIYDSDGNKFKGNKYKIRFNYNTMICRIYGLKTDYCRKGFWTDLDPHPHVNGGRGNACWGDAGSMLSSTMNAYELYASYIIVLNFLQQVNTDDVAGKYIENWDCVDENDNIIDNPYERNMEECYMCGEELDEDNQYTCQDCGHIICSEHATYIDSTDGYVCTNCLDEYYTYCSNCEEYINSDDVTFVASEDRYICYDCLDNDFTRCEECDEYYHNESNEIRYCEECERYICADCMDFHGDICEECFDEKNAEREEA